MSEYVDAHCHLDLFKNIQKEKRSEDGLGIKTITVTNAPSFFKPNQTLFGSCGNIGVALGLHPQLASQYSKEIGLFELLIAQTRYIGEIGLDGSPEYKDSYVVQKKLFEQVLRIIRKQDDKILTIHSRNSAGDTIETTSKIIDPRSSKIILHWFSGSLNELKSAILGDFYFSINHKMATSEKGKAIIQMIPEDRLLTETDAPFTYDAQIKTRTQSLEYTIRHIATIRKKSVEEIKQNIYNNFKTLLS